MEGMRIKVKVENPDNFDGSKTKDVDTWLFQVREHLDLTGNSRTWSHPVCGVTVNGKCSTLVARDL